MPKKGDVQINSFVGGLITEASPLTFQPGTSLDEVNMKLKRNGSRERRLGLDYEVDYVLNPTDLNAALMERSRQKFFRWPSPSGSNKVEIGVIQVGNVLYFIDLFNAAPSSRVLNGGFGIAAPTSHNVVFDFAIITNRLLVVAEELEQPYLLAYDEDTELVSVETARWNIRDLYGVQDDLGDGVRPTLLSGNHKYNLRNQGWSEGIVNTGGDDVDALQHTFDVHGWYPSNSDTWSLGKIEDVSSADVDKYDPITLKKNSYDLGRAARGHYVIDLYNRGRSRNEVSDVIVSSLDREFGRISTVAVYAGRGFYSGIRSRKRGNDSFSPDFSGAVLFSQVVEADLNLIKCYQKNDPTSPDQNDILDTDGGVIVISGAIDIVKLIPIKEALFVFATNGVWEIKGEEAGFKATSFQVNKITSVGVFSRDSIVEANGTVFFWAKEGIFALTVEEVSGKYEAKNITMTTIQTLYNSIPNLQKQNVRGYYDDSENTVRWLYGSDDVKILGNPIDIQANDPPTFVIGDAVSTASIGIEPKIIKVNATTAFMIYANSLSRYLYYRVATINTTTLLVTLGTETLVVDGGSTGALRGWELERLADNRIAIVSSEAANATKVRLVTFSGTTPTIGSPTTINSVFGPVVTTSRLDTAPIDSTNFIVRSRNLTNGHGSMQVINIIGSVITFGTVVNTASTDHVNPKVTMLTSSEGIYVDQAQNSIVQYTAWFSVTGVTITLKTESAHPVIGDFPSGTTSVQSLYPDVSPLSATQAIIVGSGIITNGTVTNQDGVLLYKLAISGNDVSISDATFDIVPDLSETTMYMTSVVYNGSLWIVYMDISTTPNVMYLAQYSIGVTPTQILRVSLDTSTVFETKPEIVLLDGGIAIAAYRTVSAVNEIKAVGMRLV